MVDVIWQLVEGTDQTSDESEGVRLLLNAGDRIILFDFEDAGVCAEPVGIGGPGGGIVGSMSTI
jgi:hypothetical protein